MNPYDFMKDSAVPAAEKARIDSLFSRLKQFMPIIEALAPVLSAILEATRYLSCSTAPRMGHLRRVINSIIELVKAEAAKLKRATDTEPRSAGAILRRLESELSKAFAADSFNDSLSVIEVLTPSRAIAMEAAEYKTKSAIAKARASAWWERVTTAAAQFAASSGAAGAASGAGVRSKAAAAAGAGSAAGGAAYGAADSDDDDGAAVEPQAKRPRFDFGEGEDDDDDFVDWRNEWRLYGKALEKLRKTHDEKVSEYRTKGLTIPPVTTLIDDVAVLRGLLATAPHVVNFARNVIVAQPTSVAAERIFSLSKATYAGKPRMSGETLEALVLSSAATKRWLREREADTFVLPEPVDNDDEHIDEWDGLRFDDDDDAGDAGDDDDYGFSAIGSAAGGAAGAASSA